MPDLPPCRRTSWAEAEGWVDLLADRIRRADKVPQTIAALTRGGWVPARLLADRLGIGRLVPIRAQHWGVTARPSGGAEITEGLSASVQGERVLVVDDITDTGESLQLATEHVQARGASETQSAACLHIAHSKFVPTYFAEEIPRDAWVWVVFPWNYWEDLATLGQRALDVTGSLEAAHHLLRERCRLDVPLSDLQKVLPRATPHA